MTSTSSRPTAALRFVGRPTLEAISRNPVETELFDGVAEVRHVALGQRADLIVVAPATANTIAKLAGGFADDLLGTTILASTAPLVDRSGDAHRDVEQPRDGRQHRHPRRPAASTSSARPAVSSRAPTRARDGWRSPTTSSRWRSRSSPGTPRLARPRTTSPAAASWSPPEARENPSTPSASSATARAGARGSRSPGWPPRAAPRSCSSPPTSTSTTPSGLEVRHVGTALELQEATLLAAGTADVVIMAAAVADYRPDRVADRKIKKDEQGDVLELRLVRNPDILRELARESQRRAAR